MAATFATALTDVKERIVAMQKLAVTDAQAVPYAGFSYPYSNLYWTNYIGPIPPPATGGTNNFKFRVTFVMRLHTGLVQQGYEGTLEQDVMYTHIPTVLMFFEQRRDLTYQAGQQSPDFYEGTELTISCSGLRPFPQGQDKSVLGAEFTLVLPFNVYIGRGIS